MKKRFIILPILLPLLVVAFSTSVLNAQVPDEPAKNDGCNPKLEMSQSDRLAAVDKIIAESKAEFAKSPESIRDPDVRARIGTFAAGAMHDETVLVSLDRWCWADFYEARNYLRANDEGAAFESASDWKVCLAASFPDRLDLAKPYFSCFPGKKSKSKTK